MPQNMNMANAMQPVATPQQAAQQMMAQTTARAPVAGQPVVPASPQTQAQASSNYTPSTSVSGNLQGLLQEGGSYLTQARQQGQAQAARRGLANTTLAGQAAQGEAIRAAAPLAQQEAQQQQERQNLALTTSANLQGQYAQSTQNLLNQYAISINEIETAQDISTADKNQLIQNEINRRNTDLSFLRQLYSAMPTWQPNWTTLPQFPGAPGVQ